MKIKCMEFHNKMYKNNQNSNFRIVRKAILEWSIILYRFGRINFDPQYHYSVPVRFVCSKVHVFLFKQDYTCVHAHFCLILWYEFMIWIWLDNYISFSMSSNLKNNNLTKFTRFDLWNFIIIKSTNRTFWMVMMND